MYFLEFLYRLLDSDNGISLLAALAITVIFGLQYKKLSDQQKREEMIQKFLSD